MKKQSLNNKNKNKEKLFFHHKSSFSSKKIFAWSMLVVMLFSFTFQWTINLNLTNTNISRLSNGTNIITNPKASDQIDSSRVSINQSEVYRGIEQVSITYNNTGLFDLTGRTVIANITLQDTGEQFNLTLLGIGNELYNANFTPGIQNATGQASVMIIVVDSTTNVNISTELNNDGYFTIKNNLPKIGVSMNTTEIYRGNTLGLQYTPTDIEDPEIDLNWKVEVYNGDGEFIETLVSETDSHIYDSDLYIPVNSTDYIPGRYYINATVYDSDGAENSQQYYFNIKNNDPQLLGLDFEIDGKAVTDDDNIAIYRGSQTLTLIARVSDVESNDTLYMNVEAHDPITDANVLFPLTEYQNIPITNSSAGEFIKNITFPLTMSAGVLFIKVIVYERVGTEQYSSELTQKIIIKNNAPEINDLILNGQTALNNSAKTFYTNDMLNFTFDVSDAEGEVSFVGVALLYMDGDDSKWFNYTVNYIDENTTISIRAVDLPTGDYYAYGVVIDKDGESSLLSAPIIFELQIKESFEPIVWLLFTVGIVLGVLLGIGLMILKKNKYLESSSSVISETREKSKESKKSVKNSTKNDIKDKSENKPVEEDTDTKTSTESKLKPAKSSTSEKSSKSNKSGKKSKKLIRKL